MENPGQLESEYVFSLGVLTCACSQYTLLRHFLAMTKATQLQAEKQSSSFLANFQASTENCEGALGNLVDEKSRDL